MEDCSTGVAQGNCHSSRGGGSLKEFPSCLWWLFNTWRAGLRGGSQRMRQVLFIKPSEKRCCHKRFWRYVLTLQTPITQHLIEKRKNDTKRKSQYCMEQHRLGRGVECFDAALLKGNHEKEINQNSLWLRHSLPTFPWTWRPLKLPPFGEKR